MNRAPPEMGYDNDKENEGGELVQTHLCYPPPHAGVMRCGAAEPIGLGVVCFVVINPCVLSANRVDLGFFYFINSPILLPPPIKVLTLT